MNPLPKLVDSTGRRIPLESLLASGGEGSVFPIADDPTRVAKLYHVPPSAQKVEKLAAMTAMANPNLLKVCAWPERILYDAKSQAPLGFTMPRLADVQPLQHLYNPVQRLRFFPRAGWNFQVRAALNLAAAFDEIHASGCVVGDINQTNVQVNASALVSFIDCDSFQIHANGTDFLCEVGVPHYTPPELQNQSFRGLVRTPDHDRFGLAVLIFQLLFVGRHPYAGIYQGTDDPPFEAMIAEYRFAHGPNAATWNMAPPPFTPGFDDIPPDLGKLFRQAFERDAGERPSPGEWIAALKKLESQIVDCPTDLGHKHWKRAEDCPWCRFAKVGGPEYYYGVSGEIDAFVVDERKLQDAIRRLKEVETLEYQDPRVVYAPRTPPIGRPLPRRVRNYGIKTKIFTALGSVLVAGLLYWATGSILWCLACGVGSVLGIAFLRSMFSPWFDEQDLRLAARQSAVDIKSIIEGEYDTIFHRFQRLHLAEARASKKLIAEWRALGRAPQEEIRKLANAAEQRALTRFLKLHSLADATIPNIGPGRKQTLAANGIVTAAEIDPAVVGMLKGFGPAMVANLTAWRNSVVETFQFDPSTAVGQGEQLAIVRKLRDREKAIQLDLERRLRDLEHYVVDCREKLAAFGPEMRKAVLDFEQAAADLRMLKG